MLVNMGLDSAPEKYLPGKPPNKIKSQLLSCRDQLKYIKLHVVGLAVILSRDPVTKVLIRLCRHAGSSGLLLLACKRHVFSKQSLLLLPWCLTSFSTIFHSYLDDKLPYHPVPGQVSQYSC